MTHPVPSLSARQRIVQNCDHLLCDPPPFPWLSKMLSQLLQEAQDFLGHNQPQLLAWPYNDPYSAPDPNVSVYVASLYVST